ncbi:MAG: hypothetical protein BWY63_02698 [Chloroflexi bacterium ADurb.Bin360]|nr:MAG: hypothetical protein BWY63_02698 [Chloroflexi bacterium ADurb.Bin360]HOC22325.1 hypothetical protein [Anaerolineae bacterium]
MKRMAYFSLGWSLAASPEEQERDKARIRALLKEIGLEGKFNPNINWCPIEVEVGSKAFEVLIRASGENDVGYLNRIERRYTRRELESSPLLVWYITNQAIEDDYYDLEMDGYQGEEQASHRRCLACRTELAQVRDLLVKTRKMGKRDLSLTYSFEVICSPRLIELFKDAGLTGFATRAVWDYRKSHQGEPRLFQLVVTNVLPPMASPPTEFENIQHCAACGRTSLYLKHTQWWGKIQYREETPIYYPRRVLEEAKDFNRTAEYFGDLAVATPYVIISQRAYRRLREQKVKGWAAEPVYLVE